MSSALSSRRARTMLHDRRSRRSFARWMAAAMVLAALVAVAAVTLRPPVYASTAIVDLRALLGYDNPSFENVERAERESSNQIVVAESSAVMGAVGAALGMERSAAAEALSVTSIDGTDALAFEGTASDPKEAARRAQAYADTYVRTTIERSAAGVQAEGRTMDEEVQRLTTALQKAGNNTVAANALQEQVQSLAQKRAELSSSSTALQSQQTEDYIIQPASVPTSTAGLPTVAVAAGAALATFVTCCIILLLWFWLAPMGRVEKGEPAESPRDYEGD